MGTITNITRVKNYDTNTTSYTVNNNQYRIYNHVTKKRIYTNSQKLLGTTQGSYITLTSDNYILPFTGLHSNMQFQLNASSTPPTSGPTPNLPTGYSSTESINNSNAHSAFNIGLLGFEFGGLKSIYGRLEIGHLANAGNGSPWSIKTVLGYNIKLPKNDFIIIRPELGWTFIFRQINFQSINVSGLSITQGGRNVQQTNTNIGVALHEHVSIISPAIGIWLFPNHSRLVLRVSMGYNYVLSDFYSITVGNVRQNPDQTNITCTNTNGHTSNFFIYNGLFAGLSVGIRIK